jgi:hypothetical protein
MRLQASDVLAFESDYPRFGNKGARYQIKQRGFAGSVRANQAHDFALVNMEANIPYCG